MRLLVGIATTGRAPILTETIRALTLQERLPDALLLSVGGEGDLEPEAVLGLPFPVEVLEGPKGLTKQRNRMIEACGPEDVVMMIDDDFLLAPDYLRRCEEIFAANADVVMLTGTVLADGIGGAGFDHEMGRDRLAEGLRQPAGSGLSEAYNGYGCNMAFRTGPALAHDLRFDEDLPLYGWLEDVDFSRRLAAHGRIVKAEATRGVHLGTKTGRSPGKKLGYSQIINPVYMIRKGTLAPRRAFRLMLGNLGKNILRTPFPEPWVDRWGRLKGNLLALADVARGRIDPTRVLEM
ncbi:glycosyltransferase family 2 protein [Pseudooceanicola nanhaiensis]|uniref:glycosyltransferase family 2 protein n=1 Tax=Pseudooceanicola nanhaiensis TaxID=375761 RepID=UPI001CD63C80|nr:glycosyltransferase [Pseudooceanicola nanhaiensis]MCA0921696.1 glycosyltransferase [Pseudooceanicola nanhaiensis]